MHSETGLQLFDKRTMRQVASDAMRALARANYDVDRSVLEQLSCRELEPETETAYGRQLWYFDALAVDELDREGVVYGVIEYSRQYGLNEVVEDAVFDTAAERDRYELVYQRRSAGPTWRHPAHLWILAGMVLMGVAWVAMLLLRKLML